jgi:hypothetical protein
MPTGGSQFVFQAATVACEKDISSFYSDIFNNHRLADLFELYQKWDLKYYINP